MKTYQKQYRLANKNQPHFQMIIILGICAGLLTACSVISQYGKYTGITYIAPLGDPPVESLVWSPVDPNKILVTARAGMGGPNRAQAYILDKATTGKRILAETTYGVFWGMSWSPDGKKVILASEPGTKGYEEGKTWILNLDDNSSEVFASQGDAAWFPDGKTIALFTYLRLAAGGDIRGVTLHLVDMKTKRHRDVYTNPHAQWLLGLSWSPKGDFIAFSVGDVGASDLYILNTATRQVDQITTKDGNKYPVWSPKGNMIAYQKYYKANGRTVHALHLIKPDGSCDTEVPNLDNVWSPTWSPDGMKLAFYGPDGIYTADLGAILGYDIYRDLCRK